MGNIIEIKNLNKVFTSKDKTVQALSDIDLSINDGEFISIIGSSGCGKSTLLRIIAGLEGSYEGEVSFNGEKIYKPSRERGVIFQDHRLLPWLTVYENIEFTLAPDVKDKEKIIKENIELVGLKGFEKSYPRELSGGMAQRAAIARALANKPKILLLDEPFGALDAITKINMQEELIKIWKKEKITMIIVTHDIDEAVYLGDRVVVMTPRPGKIKLVVNTDLGGSRSRIDPDFENIKSRVYKEFFKDEEEWVYNV